MSNINHSISEVREFDTQIISELYFGGFVLSELLGGLSSLIPLVRRVAIMCGATCQPHFLD